MLLQKPQQFPTTGPNTTLPYSRSSNTSDSSTIVLVECIIQENTTLKGQIEHMEAEIDKAKGLSDSLLKENQNFRQLYQERTRDIWKLIKTISIQNDEQKVDYEHQCHLLAELNYATLKQIKSLDQQRRQAQTRIDEKNQIIKSITAQKNQLEYDQLNKLKARLRNGISSEAATQLKKKYESQLEQNRYIEKEIDQLILLNTKMRGETRRILTYEDPDRENVLQQKQELQTKVAYIKEVNKRCEQELSIDKAQFEKVQADREIKEEKHTQVTRKLIQQVSKYQNLQRINALTNSDRDKMKSKIGLSHKKQQELLNELDQVKSVKEELIARIKGEKKRRISNDEQYRNQEQGMRQHHRENISKLSNQISQNETSSEQQCRRIKAEKETVGEYIISLEQEFNSLQDQIYEYNKLVKDIPNPSSEIERIQLGMRIRKIR